MAEEKANEIIEEEPAKNSKKPKKADADADTSEEEAPKKGLSTSLLIKIAIGLGVVLIAMIAAFFLLSSSPKPEDDAAAAEEIEISEADTANTEESAETALDEEAPADVVTTPETGTIDLPPVAGAEATPASNADNSAAPAPVVPMLNPATAATGSSDRVLSEMVALQKQLNTMQQENQKLIKRVEQLSRENQSLKIGGTGTNSSTANSPVAEEAFVGDGVDNVPLYYRENRYSNTPQPELKPQWGEFQQLK
jgi:flagellar basal body-associated protein FliL